MLDCLSNEYIHTMLMSLYEDSYSVPEIEPGKFKFEKSFYNEFTDFNNEYYNYFLGQLHILYDLNEDCVDKEYRKLLEDAHEFSILEKM